VVELLEPFPRNVLDGEGWFGGWSCSLVDWGAGQLERAEVLLENGSHPFKVTLSAGARRDGEGLGVFRRESRENPGPGPGPGADANLNRFAGTRTPLQQLNFHDLLEVYFLFNLVLKF
jgi:hypothetical protein